MDKIAADGPMKTVGEYLIFSGKFSEDDILILYILSSKEKVFVSIDSLIRISVSNWDISLSQSII